MDTKKIIGLNSLRYLAFLSIFIFHTTKSFKLGYLGVDFFFVLSSFLLTYLAFLEIKNTGTFSKKNFFIRRSLRIYPLYFFILIFSFFVMPIVGKWMNYSVSLPPDKAYYFFFLSNYIKTDHIFALRFLWSISVEEQFYMLFILLSPLFSKHFLSVIIGLVTIYFLYNILSFYIELDTYSNIAAHFFNFAVGMFLGYFFFINHKAIRNLVRLMLMALTILLLLIILNRENIFYNPLVSTLFGLIILMVINLLDHRKIKDNYFFRLTEFLGSYTYGLYVFSGFAITFCSKFFLFNLPILNVAAKLLLTTILAMASYHLFEMRFLGLKKYFR